MLNQSGEMAEVFEKIKQADEMQLDLLLTAIQQRHKELFPNWEIVTMSLPTDDAQKRQEILDWACENLKRMF